jgi:hypothetical protein
MREEGERDGDNLGGLTNKHFCRILLITPPALMKIQVLHAMTPYRLEISYF